MNKPIRVLTADEVSALQGRILRDVGDGTLGKVVGGIPAKDGGSGSDKLRAVFLVEDSHGLVKHELEVSYSDLQKGEYELLEGVGHTAAKVSWEVDSRRAVTPEEHERLIEDEFVTDLQDFKKRFDRITGSEAAKEQGVEIVRNTDPRIGNDLEETVVFEDGVRCRIYRGTDTYLLAGREGEREFTRQEARTIVGEMVHCPVDGIGKVTGYIELQLPDQDRIYGVDVQWSKHSQHEGKTTEAYYASFVTDEMTLLDGFSAEQARRTWDREQVMTSAEFAKDEQRRSAMKAERLLSNLASLADRETEKSNSKQIDQEQGLDV